VLIEISHIYRPIVPRTSLGVRIFDLQIGTWVRSHQLEEMIFKSGGCIDLEAQKKWCHPQSQATQCNPFEHPGKIGR
jgi:hypothetical protein